MSKTWYGHHIENIKGEDYVLFKDYLELEQRIDKAIEHLTDSINILKDSKPNDDVPVCWYSVRERYLKPVKDILQGSDK